MTSGKLNAVELKDGKTQALETQVKELKAKIADLENSTDDSANDGKKSPKTSKKAKNSPKRKKTRSAVPTKAPDFPKPPNIDDTSRPAIQHKTYLSLKDARLQFRERLIRTCDDLFDQKEIFQIVTVQTTIFSNSQDSCEQTILVTDPFSTDSLRLTKLECDGIERRNKLSISKKCINLTKLDGGNQLLEWECPVIKTQRGYELFPISPPNLEVPGIRIKSAILDQLYIESFKSDIVEPIEELTRLLFKHSRASSETSPKTEILKHSFLNHRDLLINTLQSLGIFDLDAFCEDPSDESIDEFHSCTQLSELTTKSLQTRPSHISDHDPRKLWWTLTKYLSNDSTNIPDDLKEFLLSLRHSIQSLALHAYQAGRETEHELSYNDLKTRLFKSFSAPSSKRTQHTSIMVQMLHEYETTYGSMPDAQGFTKFLQDQHSERWSEILTSIKSSNNDAITDTKLLYKVRECIRGFIRNNSPK